MGEIKDMEIEGNLELCVWQLMQAMREVTGSPQKVAGSALKSRRIGTEKSQDRHGESQDRLEKSQMVHGKL